MLGFRDLGMCYGRRYRQVHQPVPPNHTQGHKRRVGNVPLWDNVLSGRDPDWLSHALDRELWRENGEQWVQRSLT